MTFETAALKAVTIALDQISNPFRTVSFFRILPLVMGQQIQERGSMHGLDLQALESNRNAAYIIVIVELFCKGIHAREFAAP